MAETTQINRGTAEPQGSGAIMIAPVVEGWFVREILPLEAMLMHFLHRNWRNKAELEDLRQDVYARVCEAAGAGFPERPKAFVLATARNLLIDRVRHEQIVPIDAAADIDALEVAADVPGPERGAIARDVLRKLQSALDRLSMEEREVILLRRVEGLSRTEIATRLGLTERQVSEHLSQGMRALAAPYFRDPIDVGA
jgi:RNA polymerase sigma-70 factor (ECF subfamily)